MNLRNRNIVITGGTSGIGREVVRRLHRHNRVLVIARSAERLGELADAFPGVETVRADLALRADVEQAAAAVADRFARVDLLINNAALQHTPTFIDSGFDARSIPVEIDVNLTAVCLLTARLLPRLLHDGDAAILNVNSGLALAPKTGSAVYCATKAAVNVFSQSLRYQLEGTNVRVLQAFMPLVDTGMTQGRGADKMSAGDAADAMIRGIENGIEDHDIGRIRLLRALLRIAPALARRKMKAA